MVSATLLLCAASIPQSAPLVARDLSPFASVDAAVRSLPLPAPRTLSNVSQALARLAPTPLEKARAAYVWTTAHIGYASDRSRNATAALADLAGDCDAHAAIFSALCKAMGVECAKVDGRLRFAITPEASLASFSKPLCEGQWLVAHAWNAVRIDGRWGLVDTTMGGKSPKDGADADDYFLPDPAALATDHVPDDDAMRLVEAPADLAHAPIVRPLAWRMGFTQAALAADARRDETRVVLRPRLEWRRGMRAALQTAAGDEPERVLVQPTAEGTELLLCPSGPSVVWLGVPDGGTWRPIVGYPVVGSTARRLPRVMTRFYDSGASLVGPFDRSLVAGRPTEIRLRAPGASQVVAFQGASLAGSFAREGETWVLRAAPSAGTKFEIMASYSDPRQFQALLTYDVQ